VFSLVPSDLFCASAFELKDSIVSLVKIIVITFVLILSILLFGRFLF